MSDDMHIVAPAVFRNGTNIRRLALDSQALYWTDTGYVGRVAR
jgi:hypothetical protein